MSLNPSSTNRLLGYPDDARLLLVNADDFGMYSAVNEAVVAAFAAGVVQSTTLMMPCPAAAEAVQLLREHPEMRFGIHLTVVRDFAAYPWGPLAEPARVPSLLDESGHFYVNDRQREFMAQARLDEVEIEFRAQIEAALAAGLAPTHLDWHCLHFDVRHDIYDLMLALAREYGLAFRAGWPPFIARVRALGLPAHDHDTLDSYSLPVAGRAETYTRLLHELSAGLSEWAVHPSTADAASRAIDATGWPVRRGDFDFVTSAAARETIACEGIILIGYDVLQRAWREVSA
jgi:predicted glycoside hydrolase/deacetylase ChbG (UPF0249 family)